MRRKGLQVVHSVSGIVESISQPGGGGKCKGTRTAGRKICTAYIVYSSSAKQHTVQVVHLLSPKATNGSRRHTTTKTIQLQVYLS